MGRSLKTLIKNGVVITSYDKENSSAKVSAKESALMELNTDPELTHNSIFHYLHKVLLRPLLVSFGLSNYLDPTVSSDKSAGENKNDDLRSNSSDSFDSMENDHISHLETLKYSNNNTKTAENREEKSKIDARYQYVIATINIIVIIIVIIIRHKHLEKILDATLNDHSLKNR